MKLPNTMAALVAVAMAGQLAATAPALSNDAKPGTIAVSATGEAEATPDMAIVTLTVLREAKTAREALDANNTAMNDVLAAMKAEGIADRDLQTSSFYIQPRYIYPRKSSSDPQKPPKIVGYTVSNSLTVRIRELAKTGAVLDKSVTLGVNSGGGIVFTVAEPEPVIEEARKNAVMKAIAKAKTIASTAGASLGRLIEISETSRHQPIPQQMGRVAKSLAAEAVPVAAGESSYSVTVNVRWELAE